MRRSTSARPACRGWKARFTGRCGALENRKEIEKHFPKVMRRVFGYNLDELVKPGAPFDLSKIAVGSEGTLGGRLG
jgi:hypothetical protein